MSTSPEGHRSPALDLTERDRLVLTHMLFRPPVELDAVSIVDHASAIDITEGELWNSLGRLIAGGYLSVLVAHSG